jgi:hypothetical protein
MSRINNEPSSKDISNYIKSNVISCPISAANVLLSKVLINATE